MTMYHKSVARSRYRAYNLKNDHPRARFLKLAKFAKFIQANRLTAKAASSVKIEESRLKSRDQCQALFVRDRNL